MENVPVSINVLKTILNKYTSDFILGTIMKVPVCALR